MYIYIYIQTYIHTKRGHGVGGCFGRVTRSHSHNRVRSVSAEAGRARRGRPQAWTGCPQRPGGLGVRSICAVACPHAIVSGPQGWASFAFAYWQGARFCWSSAPGRGLICSSLSPCYVFGPRRKLRMRPVLETGPLKRQHFNLLQRAPS